MPTDRTRLIALPWAAKAQGIHEAADEHLTRAAQATGHAVRWWWGRRPAEDGRRSIAVCYICTRAIVSWSGTTRIPGAAVDAVLVHRSGHLLGASTPTGDTAPGTDPDASQHRPGGEAP